MPDVERKVPIKLEIGECVRVTLNEFPDDAVPVEAKVVRIDLRFPDSPEYREVRYTLRLSAHPFKTMITGGPMHEIGFSENATDILIERAGEYP